MVEEINNSELTEFFRTSIYKSDRGKEAILSLYERQLERLDKRCENRYIDTTFGKTYLIETGNFAGVPLLVFHGGNATTAYNLLGCDFLMKDFHIYAVDTIGHPGCVVPHKMEKVVLYVPSGISNAPSINGISMMLPMIMYWITRKDKWLRKCMLPMAITEENITDDIYETAKLSIDFSRVKTKMPSK